TLLEGLLPALPAAEQPGVQAVLASVQRDQKEVEQTLRTRVAESLGQQALPPPSPTATAAVTSAATATAPPAAPTERAAAGDGRSGARALEARALGAAESRRAEPAASRRADIATPTAARPSATP